MSVSAPALAQRIAFNVPERPAVAGIPQFAHQAGIQIVSPAGLAGLKTHAVIGHFTVEEGLRRLLRSTGLHLVARNGNILSLALSPRVSRQSATKPKPAKPARSRSSFVAAEVSASPPEPDTDIIVTGTVSPERRLDAGLAVTTVSLDRIHELAPNNTADLLKLAPGIWAETTGGATGANIFVRGFPTTGDAPFLTVQLDGAPIYPPTELAFSENTTLFRIDDMIDRVEILRGGTSPIFSNGQPGAVMNFVQRTGTPDLQGGLRLTTTDYGTHRADGYLTGPLARDTTFAFGGFYRTSDGLRNTQFLADRGGQASANVTHEFANGKITAYVRYTRDHNAFYTGAPLIANADGSFGALPGFDPLRDTLIGRDTQHLSIETGPREFRAVDLDEGRGVDLLFAGTSFDWSVGHVRVTNRLNVTKGDANTIGLFTGPVPETLGQYIIDTVARANANGRTIAAAGPASSGQGVIAATGVAIPADRYVLTAGLWSVRESIAAVTNELRVSTTINSGHQLTGGFYLSHYQTGDRRILGNNLLLLAEPNAQRIDVRLDNGVQATRDGFVSAATSQIVGRSKSTNMALFLDDDWAVSERTSLDVGVRLEHQMLRGEVRDVLPNVDFDDDPLTLYNNNGALLLASSRTLGDDAERLSWAAGLVHRLVPGKVTLHARLNHGSNLQSFDKLRIGGQRTQSADVLEAGVDVGVGPIRGSANVFLNRFDGLQFTRLLANADGSVGSILLAGGARAYGLELETTISPTPRWSVELQGTFQDGRYRGFGGNNGNRVVRQPNIHLAVAPVYTTRIASAPLRVRATFTFVGRRFSDVENLQRLPSYSTVDLSLHAGSDRGFYGDVVVQNLCNAFGLTEGNTRVIGAVLSSGPIVARPLFARNFSASIGYRF
ncbi:TonB-dependent receptor domain-containing protein [Sphingomonas xinjiangensis]|uniref:Outer membrane receptor protein involved in Fe transport n=1 Tax=Sphingomonas xinjiangensis TaxID=643568 RepID=A0A840YST6_9SPHN|nr:TonB-dependent receptor [Sphingomonas xinjiangensis]MBB5712722.1 outer membrane receptor protein involved in Fe transport [Sphingomonas xinjiangensis]